MSLVAAFGAFGAWSVWQSKPEDLAGADKNGTRLLLYYICINIAIAMCDSLSQGNYTEICKWKGSTVVSFVSGSKIMAGMIAALVGPRINDSIGPQENLGILIPFFGQLAVVTGFNFMGDIRLPSCCSFDSAIWRKDYKIIVTGLILGLIAALLVVFRLLNNVLDSAPFTPTVLLIFSGVGMLGILAATFWSLPHAVAKINVYIMFCRVATLDVRYTLQQWYTVKEIGCPGQNTPHFPNTVYQMVGLIMGSAFTLVGIWLFENYVYYWNAQKAFWVTTLFTVVAALFDLSMLTGFNRTLWKWLPVMSTKVTWLCGDCPGPNCGCDPDGTGTLVEGYRLDDMFGFLIGMQALKPIATTLDDMPSTVLLSKLCPAGVETTVFAMLAALMNLGLTVSGLMAGFVFKLYGVDISNAKNPDTGETEYTCEFGKGYIPGLNGIQEIMVIGGMILPLATIPATWALIPNQPLNEKFVDEAPAAEALDNADAHPAAAFGKQSPSFADLGDTNLASQKELEEAASIMFNRRSGSALLAGSRVL